jgi:hypothetical protein
MPEEAVLLKAFESYPDLKNPLKRDRVEIYEDRIVHRMTDSSELVKGAAKMLTGIGMFHGARQIAKAAWKQGGLVSKNEAILQLGQITAVNLKIDNPIYRTIEVTVASEITGFRVKKEDAEEIRDLISERSEAIRKTVRIEGFAPGAPASPPNAQTGSTAGLEQLKALGELHKAGVLSDEEFSAKKAEILGRI